MKKHFLNGILMQGLSLGLLFLFASVAAYAQRYSYESIPNDSMQARIYILKNGLKIYLSANKEKPHVQTHIVVRMGSRSDPKETIGLAHYLEYPIFKGTTHFGSSNVEAERPYLDSIEARFEQYRRITDPTVRKQWYRQINSVSQPAARCNIPNEYGRMVIVIGSEGINTYTSNDITCYVEDIPSDEINTWTGVQGNRLQSMVIRSFHTELEAVHEEYNIGFSGDWRKIYAALPAKPSPIHPYGIQTTIGLDEHLENSSITNIKNYFNKYYIPDNIAICLSNDLDPGGTVVSVEKYFGDQKPSVHIDVPQFPAQPAPAAPVDMTVVGKEAPMLFMGWHVDASKLLQLDTLEVIAQFLSNGQAGLLDLDFSQKLRIREVSAGIADTDEYSVFYICGQPKSGQALQEVHSLILSEIEKLEKGSFSDDLLPSIVNDYRRYYHTQLNNSQFRAKQCVDAFIDHKDWKWEMNKLNRISKLTKTEIVKFVNQFFRSDLARVYREQGNDTTIKKVEEPTITPIPTNNDKQSSFLKETINTKITPIQPQLADYKHDLTKATTQRGLPVLCKQDRANDLFTLCFVVPYGNEHNPMFSYVVGYLDYLGTNKLSNEQIKQQFYKLACDYNFSERNEILYITLGGLNSNLPQALTLLNNLLGNTKVGKEAYDLYVKQTPRSHSDNKTNQNANFTALRNYATYGERNPTRNVPNEQVLKSMNPQELFNFLKDLKNYKLTVLYYGPPSPKEVDQLVSKTTQTPKKFVVVPAIKRYAKQTTPKNEVLIVPYDTKDTYMVQPHDQNQKWPVDRVPIIILLNECFGGGMNAIVFQELREACGLAYSASTVYASPYCLGGNESFYTYIITQNNKIIDYVTELNKFLNNIPVRQSGFDLVKQSPMKSLTSVRITKYFILTSHLAVQRLSLDTSLSERIYNTLPSLQLQDVINFEREYIANRTSKCIIPSNEKELGIKVLEKAAPIGRVATEEIFGH